MAGPPVLPYGAATTRSLCVVPGGPWPHTGVERVIEKQEAGACQEEEKARKTTFLLL